MRFCGLTLTYAERSLIIVNMSLNNHVPSKFLLFLLYFIYKQFTFSPNTQQKFEYIFYLDFLCLRVRLEFTLWHNNPAAHQDYCGSCRIRTRDLCSEVWCATYETVSLFCSSSLALNLLARGETAAAVSLPMHIKIHVGKEEGKTLHVGTF